MTTNFSDKVKLGDVIVGKWNHRYYIVICMTYDELYNSNSCTIMNIGEPIYKLDGNREKWYESTIISNYKKIYNIFDLQGGNKCRTVTAR